MLLQLEPLDELLDMLEARGRLLPPRAPVAGISFLVRGGCWGFEAFTVVGPSVFTGGKLGEMREECSCWFSLSSFRFVRYTSSS